MPLVGMNSLTLLDYAKRLGPDHQISRVIELLQQTNEILDDAMWLEANNITSHRTTIRTGLPESYWRLLNRGVPRSKSRTTQIDDPIGILETWSVVDSVLAELNGTRPEFMLSEERAFLEGMNQRLAETIFYGHLKNEPAAFTGFAPRYSSISAESGENIVDMGGTGNANTSAWLVVWGDMTAHMTYPKGFTAGLKRTPMDKTTAFDEDNNEFIAYKTNYSWNAGLVVRDWRYVVRVANIAAADLDNLFQTGAASAASQKLVRGMIKAHNAIPNIRLGRAAWYMNRTVKTMLDFMAAEKSNVNLTIGNFEGQEVTTFKGVPIRQCDTLLNTEDAVA